MSIPLDPKITVGDAASRWPALIPFFERHGIDYCCKGGVPLMAACEQAGISLDALANASVAPDAGEPTVRDWSNGSMSELCDHIVTHFHGPTRQRFESLRSLIPAVVEAHSQHAPWLKQLEEIERELEDEMNDHMIREERVLFPWIARLEKAGAVTIGPPWSVKRPIDCMMHDHDSVGSALRRIRDLTNDPRIAAWACPTTRRMLEQLRGLETDTHLHIHLENNVLFPAAVRAEKLSRRSSSADRATQVDSAGA